MTNKPVMRPWGLSRASEITGTIELGYTSVEVDPQTQLGLYRDATGHQVEPMEMSPKHGSGTETRPRTGTNQDGKSDSDTGFDGDRD